MKKKIKNFEFDPDNLPNLFGGKDSEEYKQPAKFAESFLKETRNRFKLFKSEFKNTRFIKNIKEVEKAFEEGVEQNNQTFIKNYNM